MNFEVDPKWLNAFNYGLPGAIWSGLPLQLATALQPPPAVFEFDKSGSAEGFAGNYFRDDKDVPYGPPMPVSQFPLAQYKQPFPLPPGSAPPYGVLVVQVGQFGQFAKTFNFPSGSDYWYQDVISPSLISSDPWQKVKNIEAWFWDDASITGNHISAEIFASGSINGAYQNVKVASSKLKHDAWVQIKAPFSLGQGMALHNLVIRIKGEWAKSSLSAKKMPHYEGFVLIDHISAS